jgi:DNA-binding beta-propeller fold protein YncE
MFALSADGTRVCTANVDTGSLSIIDVATETLLDVVDVAGEINRISLSPDGVTAFSADQQQPRLAAIDLRTSEVTWIDLPSRGFGSAVTPDGRFLVVTLRWASQIGVVELSTRSVVAVVDVPAQPQAIVIHPDGTHAYSACDAAQQVVEIDLGRYEVSRRFDAGADADGICWARVPVTASDG